MAPPAWVPDSRAAASGTTPHWVQITNLPPSAISAAPVM